jgi:hypothetical protein
LLKLFESVTKYLLSLAADLLCKALQFFVCFDGVSFAIAFSVPVDPELMDTEKP